MSNPLSSIRDRIDAPDSPTDLQAHAQETRRYRISSPRLAVPLPPYDIRVRRELAHRRTIVAIGRHILRVVSLLVLDAAAAGAASRVSLAIIPVTKGNSITAMMVGFTLLGLLGRGTYQAAHHRRDPWRIVTGIALAMLAGATTAIVPDTIKLPFPFIFVFGVIATAAVLGERAVVDVLVRQLYAYGVGLRRAVVVGKASDVEGLMQGLRADQRMDHLIVGHVAVGPASDPSALGHLVDLESIVRREEPVELILCTQLPAEAFRRVADICVRNGVSILAIPSWTKLNRGWAEPVVIGKVPGFWLHPVRLEMPSLFLKRCADIVFTSVGLVLCLPVITLIGVAIKIDSPGPVFFRQRRVGLGGREFTIWKFRSMHHMSERRRDEVAHLNHYADARLFKAQNDPRITRVGRWLRRFSLDELPQLFNIIVGDMSLVGPRPPLPHEVKKYEARHFVRLTVVPGLTGPWQVGGRNLITDFEEVVRIEQEYVERWTFRLDLKIMFKTIGVMLSGKGAF